MRSFLLLCLIVQGYQCLRDVRLLVPDAVRAGDSLTLGCVFTLEQEHLYSVKFYLGDTELYRYVPEESPATRVFPLDGVNVDVSRSNSSAVTLSHVHRALSGLYKCEVSADAPLFHTGIQAAFVTVTEEPWALPSITAEKLKYNVGEKVRANCTSQGGYPPANLTWFINDQQVVSSPQTKVLYQTSAADTDTAVLRLEMVATALAFSYGKLRLRCDATQFSLYRRTAQLELLEDTPKLAPVLGPTASQQESCCGRMVLQMTTQIFVFLLLIANHSFFHKRFLIER